MTCSIDPGAALRSKAVSSQGAILASEQSAAQHSVRPTRGFCAIYRNFSGFGFILLSNRISSRPIAANASRYFFNNLRACATYIDITTGFTSYPRFP